MHQPPPPLPLLHLSSHPPPPSPPPPCRPRAPRFPFFPLARTTWTRRRHLRWATGAAPPPSLRRGWKRRQRQRRPRPRRSRQPPPAGGGSEARAAATVDGCNVRSGRARAKGVKPGWEAPEAAVRCGAAAAGGEERQPDGRRGFWGAGSGGQSGRLRQEAPSRPWAALNQGDSVTLRPRRCTRAVLPAPPRLRPNFSLPKVLHRPCQSHSPFSGVVS